MKKTNQNNNFLYWLSMEGRALEEKKKKAKAKIKFTIFLNNEILRNRVIRLQFENIGLCKSSGVLFSLKTNEFGECFINKTFNLPRKIHIFEESAEITDLENYQSIEFEFIAQEIGEDNFQVNLSNKTKTKRYK